MPRITLSEALTCAKTLAARRAELVALRNQNARVVKQAAKWGGEGEGIITQTPTYDAIALDKQIATIAREERILDAAVKRMNAKTYVEDYAWNDDVLGELAIAPIAQ